jgi:hypothetical protein
MLVTLGVLLFAGASAPAESPRSMEYRQPAGRVSLWVDRSDPYRRGEGARVFAGLEGAAYLTVLRVDTDGRIRTLFPSEPWSDAYVHGGRDGEIGGAGEWGFRVDDNPGVGYVFAIASAHPFDYSEITRGDYWDYRLIGDGRVRGDPYVALTDLADRIAPDGEYHVRVSLRRQGRVVTSGRKIFLDTRPPSPVVGYVKPSVITPGAPSGTARSATLRYSGPKRRPVLLVYRTDLGRPRLVARHTGRSGRSVLRWDGRVGLRSAKRPAPAGSYLLAVRVRDAAGNAGPAQLPPRRGAVAGHPGVTVRYIAAVAPGRPVLAGTRTTVKVLAAGRRYRWRVHRLGSARTVSRGVSRSGTLRVRAPRGGSTVAVLELRSGSHRYVVPFAVRGGGTRRVLVVLPVTTWQALNPAEVNGDGYPDVLPLDRAVPVDRPFARDGRPPGFAAAAAQLRFLRASGFRYDVTTDLTLLRDGGAPLRAYRGVLVAGPERFAPSPLTRAFDAYVRGGGRLAWIGTGAFARTVSLAGSSIVRGGAGTPFGERVRPEPGPRALVVLGDTIDFFSGLNAAFGPFPRIEPSLQLPRGARPLASAGAEPRRPDVVVYRHGRGVVARIGVDGFGPSPATPPSATRIMRRLWALLSR